MKGNDANRKAFTFPKAVELHVFRVINLWFCDFFNMDYKLDVFKAALDPLQAIANISVFLHLETYLTQKRKICFLTTVE